VIQDQQFQAMIEYSSDMIGLHDRDGCLSYLSPSTSRLLGYHPADLVGHSMYNLVHPDDQQRIAALFERLVDSPGATITAEYRLRHADGSWRWMEGTGTNLLDEPGVRAVVVNFHDITSLKESEARYKLLASAAFEGLIIHQDGKHVDVNEAFASLLGYEREELIGLSPWALAAPESRATIAEHARSGSDEPYEAIGVRKDGSRLDLEIRGRSFFDGERALRVVAVRDITERKRAEAALREKEAQYRGIFEATSDGLDVLDLESGLIVEANPAVCRMLGYAYDELIGLHASRFIHPEDMPLLAEYLATIKAGGEFRRRVRNIRKDGSTFLVEVTGKSFLYQGRPHALGIVRDITQQIETERVLEERVQARTRELSALYRADETLHRSLRLDDVLQALVHEAVEILEADKATVLVWDASHSRLVPGASYGFLPETVARMSHGPGQGITWRVAESGHPISVEDAETDPRVAHHITDPERIRSLLHVPITVGGEVFGVFGVNYCQTRRFTGDEQRLLLALAQRAALAINNARLYARTEQRSREVEALYRADEALHASLKLDDVLQALVDVATDILDADKTAVMVWDERHTRLAARAGRGFSPESLARMVHGPGEGVTWLVASTGRPIAIDDVRQDPRVARHLADPEGIRSFLQVPITIGGEVFGVFGVNHCQLHTFTADEQRVLVSLAHRAALAINNARLYEQAEGKAALEERQKLARELHDSVSQALYGIGLGARTARTLLDRDPSALTEPLDYVLGLSEAGLAEMRALIFELRPESLQQEGLCVALDKHAASLRARYGLAVEFAGCEPDAAISVKEAAYRIAQEALHNVTKHAHASHVELRLTCEPDRLTLDIQDDGAGFDPSASYPGHLGLHSMRERAERLGGSLDITSVKGEGTHIQARLPLRP
jgi:PAS domain S-box-containing protein